MPVLSTSQKALASQSSAGASAKALPPFPKLFAPLTAKFPDMADDLADVEKRIEEWVKSLQITGV